MFISPAEQTEIKWPIIYVDRGGWVYMARDKGHLDVERAAIGKSEIVKVWDINGLPLRIIWAEEAGPVLEIISATPDKEGLRKAILNWAQAYIKDRKFLAINERLEDLYIEANNFIEENWPKQAARLLRERKTERRLNAFLAGILTLVITVCVGSILFVLYFGIIESENRETFLRRHCRDYLQTAKGEVHDYVRVHGELPPRTWQPPLNARATIRINYVKISNDFYIVYCPEALEGKFNRAEILKAAEEGIQPGSPWYHYVMEERKSDFSSTE